MFKLSVVTPEKTVLEQDVTSIVAPGAMGYLGILTDHAPLITPLIAGKLEVKDVLGKESIFFISGGFLEVSKNIATILADAMEKPQDIDIMRAKAAEKRARERLAHRSEKDVDAARAEAALRRAIWRQKLGANNN
jgi:F-type H+-transporting ATPase subunit epsilon